MWADWLATWLNTMFEPRHIPVYLEVEGKCVPALALETKIIDGRKVLVIQDRIE